MKKLLSILFIIAIAGCKTTSTVSSTLHNSTDSTEIHVQQVNNKTANNYRHTTEKDSAVGLPAANVGLHLMPDDLQPATTVNGVKVPRYYFADSATLHGSVVVNPDGSIDVRCKSDSLTLVIKSLIRDSIYQAQTNDSLRTQLITKKQTTTDKSDTKTVTKQGGFWGFLDKLKWIGIGVIIGFLLTKLMPLIIKLVKHWMI